MTTFMPKMNQNIIQRNSINLKNLINFFFHIYHFTNLIFLFQLPRKKFASGMYTTNPQFSYFIQIQRYGFCFCFLRLKTKIFRKLKNAQTLIIPFNIFFSLFRIPRIFVYLLLRIFFRFLTSLSCS